MSIAELMTRENKQISADSIWQKIQEKLKAEFGEATYKSWLSKLEFTCFSNHVLNINAPTKFMKEWVMTHYAAKIKNLWKEFDSSILSIEITTNRTNSSTNNTTTSITNSSIEIENKDENTSVSFLEDNISASLDERFTFDNFVVGGPNELAYAAAKSVAESSIVRMESNPLFLYGGVGLGKTHLMHAIAWQIIKNKNDRKVLYLSAEKFMYLFVTALRKKDIMSFKKYFRSVDVLMVDDVQFICGKDSTQEEFFHTFNTLIDNNCQVVISADRSPTDLEGMEDRIKSRLGWGLVVDLHSTTYELRLGILESKIEQMKVSVPKSVIEFLAAKITSNVRELEGALNKVVAHSRLINREITLENTYEILKDLLRSVERVISIEDIQKKTAEHFNIKISDLVSSRRLRSLARPRQIAMYLAKNFTSKSLAVIGKKFGGKDHTTVMHAIKTVESLIAKDFEVAEDVKILSRKVDN
jgi:chromosomal replication initiator protein